MCSPYWSSLQKSICQDKSFILCWAYTWRYWPTFCNNCKPPQQIHISCPDKESLYNAIQDAFRKVDFNKPTIFPLGATDVFDYTEFYKSIVNKPSPTIKFLANLGLQSFKRLHRTGKLCFFITETGSKVATSCLNLIAWQRLLRKLQKVNLLEANVLKKFVRLFVQDFIKHP